MKNKSLKERLVYLPKISVSVLNSDLVDLKNVVKILDSLNIDIIHLDIMDGHFVPNLTFGPLFVKSLRKYTKSFFDVHLMIEEPYDTIHNYVDAGADIIVVHLESLNKKYILKTINKIKSHNIFCGISIKPKTPVDLILPYLKYLDLVLIMTVEPGFGGQKLIKDCLKKISKLDDLRKKENFEYLISCDGGINEKNFLEIVRLGCDLPVVGNAIFGQNDFVGRLKFFQSLTKIK